MNTRMKMFIVLSGLISGAVFAGAQESSKYPLRVHIVDVRGSTTTTSNIYGNTLSRVIHANGHGNIEDGSSWRGFDYDFECEVPLDVTPGSLSYEGRWKKAETRLGVLIPEIGNPKKHTECELRTTLRDFVYGYQQGGLVTYTIDQYAKMLAVRKPSPNSPPIRQTPEIPIETWRAVDVAYAPWTFSFRIEGNTVKGTVSQGRINAANGHTTAATNPVEIYDGAIQGNKISFKCNSPGSGDRVITFNGEINGDEIAFSRIVQLRPGADPGEDGIYGASGASRFTAKRDTGVR